LLHLRDTSNKCIWLTEITWRNPRTIFLNAHAPRTRHDGTDSGCFLAVYRIPEGSETAHRTHKEDVMSTRKKPGLTYGLLLGVALAAFGPLEILSSRSFAAENPVPLINQPLVPDAIAPGGAGFTLTVNGTGFVSGAVVNWNHSVLATTFVKNSQLTASVPA